MRYILLLALTALCGCAINQPYAPMYGQAACMQVFEHEPANPFSSGAIGWVFYDCTTRRIIATGASQTGSFVQSIPSAVVTGASAAIPATQLK